MAKKKIKKSKKPALWISAVIILIVIFCFFIFNRQESVILANSNFSEVNVDTGEYLAQFDIVSKTNTEKNCKISVKGVSNETYYMQVIGAKETIRKNITFIMPIGNSTINIKLKCS